MNKDATPEDPFFYYDCEEDENVSFQKQKLLHNFHREHSGKVGTTTDDYNYCANAYQVFFHASKLLNISCDYRLKEIKEFKEKNEELKNEKEFQELEIFESLYHFLKQNCFSNESLNCFPREYYKSIQNPSTSTLVSIVNHNIFEEREIDNLQQFMNFERNRFYIDNLSTRLRNKIMDKERIANEAEKDLTNIKITLTNTLEEVEKKLEFFKNK